MGTCTVNSVEIPDGSSWPSGVKLSILAPVHIVVLILLLFVETSSTFVGICGEMQVLGGEQMCRRVYQYL